MKKLLVLALMLVATSAFAQADPNPNGIGLYADEAGMSNTVPAAAPYTVVNFYLLATRITEPSGISGWECELEVIPAPAVAPTYTLNGGINVLTAPIFQVGLASALPFAPAIKLCTVGVLNFGSGFNLGLGPCTPSSFTPPSPGYAAGNDPGNLIRLTPSCNTPDPQRPGFYLLASFINPPPVANENDSWGNVKALYQ